MAEDIVVRVDPELEDIMPRYLDIRGREVVEMAQALAADDMETVRLLGHRLKGSGASYGFEELTRLGAAIEKAALAGDKNLAEDLSGKVRDYLARLRVVFA